VQVTEHRTAQDFAYAMPWLVDEASPAADVIRIILDKLTTPKSASLDEAFTPAEARRIARKLAWHDPPKHGSWLNRAEIALSVLPQQCLGRRRPHADTLTRKIAAWEHQRNLEKATMDWRFSVTDARQKLESLYPSLPS
jgi:hypothetical protein